MAETKEIKKPHSTRYLTHNLYYAAYLVYRGNECVGLVPSKIKEGFLEFSFDWIDNVKEFETTFFSEQGVVEPRAYTKCVQKMTDMLREARGIKYAGKKS